MCSVHELSDQRFNPHDTAVQPPTLRQSNHTCFHFQVPQSTSLRRSASGVAQHDANPIQRTKVEATTNDPGIAEPRKRYNGHERGKASIQLHKTYHTRRISIAIPKMLETVAGKDSGIHPQCARVWAKLCPSENPFLQNHLLELPTHELSRLHDLERLTMEERR